MTTPWRDGERSRSDPASREGQDVAVEKIALGAGEKQHGLCEFAARPEPSGGDLSQPLSKILGLPIGLRPVGLVVDVGLRGIKQAGSDIR